MTEKSLGAYIEVWLLTNVTKQKHPVVYTSVWCFAAAFKCMV